MKKWAFLFPGQGAQYVGMGKDFFDRFEEARKIFLLGDEVLHRPFSRLIFEGPQEELTQTKNSQPAIYLMSFALLKVVQSLYPDLQPFCVAGLSLGEYTALAASGKISFEEGLCLVVKRAEAMQRACEECPGSMRVVLGMQEQEIQAILAEGKEAWIANVNCPGQVVIAGTLQGLESAAEALKKGGAKRVLPLEVSGAFHSPLMKSAQEALTPAFMSVALSDSSIRPVMNTPGDFVDDVASIRAFLIKQVTHPVYWQQGILSMVKQQVDGFIEIGCGKTLQGMNKRIGIPLPTFSVEKVEELEGLATAIME